MAPPTLRQIFTPLLRPKTPRFTHSHPRLSSSTSTTTPSTHHTRLTRLLSRLPPSLRPYTQRLLTSPTTHIISFLLLHELTAIIPLLGLTFTFHYTHFTPTSLFKEDTTGGKYIHEGVERFSRYFARKGWFGFTPANTTTQNPSSAAEDIDIHANTNHNINLETNETVGERFNVSSASSKILIEVATAYAITKVLLPLRIMGSLWATPWFARVVIGRFGGLFARFGRRGGKDVVSVVRRSGAAGTGATGGGVVGKGS